MKKILSKYSFGVGDRFAHQAKPQLRAMIKAKEAGCAITPVWNKSYREHEIIGSKSFTTRSAVDKAVADLNWDEPYFLDADHINLKNVDFFIDTCDFYTIDVAEYIGRPIDGKKQKIFYEKNKNFIGQLEFPGIDSIEVTPALIQAVAEKYLYAIYEAKKIYDYITINDYHQQNLGNKTDAHIITYLDNNDTFHIRSNYSYSKPKFFIPLENQIGHTDIHDIFEINIFSLIEYKPLENVKTIPMIFMDGQIHNYLKGDKDTIITTIRPLIQELKNVGGVASINFHQRFFHSYYGYKEIYEKLLNYLSEEDVL